MMRADVHQSIRAYVILRGKGGSIAAGGISAANVQEFMVDRSARERIRQTLERLGFAVVRVSPFSITIQAPRRQYESVFQAPLRQSAPQGSAAQRDESASWERPPIIPAELEGVDTVVFAQPVDLVSRETR